MKQGGRIEAAIEVVADMEARKRPVSDALKNWGLAHRFAGSGDRAVIGNIVYDTVRWRQSSAWVMGADTPRALVLGTMAHRWKLDAAAFGEMFAGDPHAPAPLVDEEIARIGSIDVSGAPPHVRADVPEWLVSRLERAFGDAWVGEGEGLALRPPLDMRVNRLKGDRTRTLGALARFGAVATAFSPDGLRIAATEGNGRHPNVQVEPSFQKGWFEVQDEGSQIAALLVGVAPGEQVLDLCAGAGGKTLAMSAAMANKGQIFATDSDRTRLAPIFDRLRRAGARNVQIREAGAPLDDLTGRMDAVLVDAPCTGTGVWRRRPDAKWRLTDKAVAERVAEQAALLRTAAEFVRPGGRLIYVTCSLLPEENADQVAAFLAHDERFAPVNSETALSACLDPPTAAALAGASYALPHGIMLTPAKTGTDGFFISVMRRAVRAPG